MQLDLAYYLNKITATISIIVFSTLMISDTILYARMPKIIVPRLIIDGRTSMDDYINSENEKNDFNFKKICWDYVVGVYSKKTLRDIPIANPLYRSFWIKTFGFGWHNKSGDIHHGLDMGAQRDTMVRSAANGIVIKAGWNGNYGRYVIILHKYGFETVYGHFGKLNVKSGDRVTPYTVIGLVGNSGNSTGPHLHYEIWYNGKVINPEWMLKYNK
jgi:murein DD-endopeptidase MepM/ murein hydrolase activator NlpD